MAKARFPTYFDAFEYAASKGVFIAPSAKSEKERLAYARRIANSIFKAEQKGQAVPSRKQLRGHAPLPMKHIPEQGRIQQQYTITFDQSRAVAEPVAISPNEEGFIMHVGENSDIRRLVRIGKPDIKGFYLFVATGRWATISQPKVGFKPKSVTTQAFFCSPEDLKSWYKIADRRNKENPGYGSCTAFVQEFLPRSLLLELYTLGIRVYDNTKRG